MKFTERTDSYDDSEFNKYKGTSDSFGSPKVSSHIWNYELPKLVTEIHVAIVRALDEFGFEDEGNFTFDITE